MSKSIKELVQENKDLRLYIRYLECMLDETEVIEWDDITDMIFTKPVYTSVCGNDKMAEFNFIPNFND